MDLSLQILSWWVSLEVQISERIGEKYRRELERLKSPHYSILNNEGILALFLTPETLRAKQAPGLRKNPLCKNMQEGRSGIRDVNIRGSY